MRSGFATLAWYVVHTKPRQELLAASLLEERWPVTVYAAQVVQRRGGRTRRVPLFPGYLFVQADLEQTPASALNAVPGVVRLVAFGARPQPVPAAVVARLVEQVDALNAAGGLPAHPFRPGDVVQLTSGPLAGLDAVFVGPMRPAERVRVLLAFLGSLSEVEVAVTALAPVAAARRVRRTRGKGRRVRPGSEF